MEHCGIKDVKNIKKVILMNIIISVFINIKIVIKNIHWKEPSLAQDVFPQSLDS